MYGLITSDQDSMKYKVRLVQLDLAFEQLATHCDRSESYYSGRPVVFMSIPSQ